MDKRRVTFTVDEYLHELLAAAAARAGMSLPAWVVDAARREAVRQGAPPEPEEWEVDALAADADRAAAEAELRAAG